MDERYGAAHDYTRKTGVAASFILAPDNAPDWMSNRSELWNAVEAVERRKDAQLCREVLLSLPHEMTDDQREVNRPGFTGGQNSRRIARYGTDTKEEDLEAVFT